MIADLKQLFDRKRDKSEQDTSMHLPERDRPERQVPSSRAKRNNFVERNVDEDHTIKINEREEPYNVKAFLTAD